MQSRAAAGLQEDDIKRFHALGMIIAANPLLAYFGAGCAQ
jgi:hypothetical protein